jgi:transcriptional regulator with XRE-family HTH domain
VRKGVDKKSIKLFGKRVASVRKEKSLTQQALAFETGLSLSQIARIETGAINTTLNTIFIIAQALEVEPKTLLDFAFPKTVKAQ